MASLEHVPTGSEEIDLGGEHSEGVDTVVELTAGFQEQVNLSLSGAKSDPDSDVLSRRLGAETLARLAAYAQLFFSQKLTASGGQDPEVLAKTA